jgi:hypothetical protein
LSNTAGLSALGLRLRSHARRVTLSLSEQVSNGHLKRGGDSVDIQERHIPKSALDSRNVGTIKIGLFSKGLLR